MRTVHTVPEPVAVRLARCPVCGARDLSPRPVPLVWIGEDTFGRHRGAFGVTGCEFCSFEFVNPRPSDALLQAFYSGTTYACHDPATTDSFDAHALRLLDFMAKHVRGRRLLDFGCGAGVLLRSAKAAGWAATGYDLGAAAIENCRQQGLTVTSNLPDLPRESFDSIVLSHVFEHVTDHGATLDAVRPLLAPGGRLFIECPNVKSLRARLSHPALSRHARFDERYRAFPIHLSYFSPRTLIDLLSRHDFHVERSTTSGFGLEELVLPIAERTTDRRKEARRADSHWKPSRARPPRKVRVLKHAVKFAFRKLILDTGLGENVVIVARARREPAQPALA